MPYTANFSKVAIVQPATQGYAVVTMRGLPVNYSDEGEEGKLPRFASNSPDEEFVTMTEHNTEDRARLDLVGGRLGPID